MTVSLKIVVDDLSRDGGPYAPVVEHDPAALIYHSVKYGRFLKTLMPHARCEYLVAVDDRRPVAALPTFALPSAAHGTVVNSLPFYGSHGGLLLVPDGPENASSALLAAFHDRNRASGVVAATIVGNPNARERSAAGDPADLHDRRIGQFSTLPAVADRDEIEIRLFAQYHQKTRNMVRKGLKAGYIFREDASPAMFARLAEMHEAGMRAIGGKFKGPDFFAAVQTSFAHASDYRLFVAESVSGEIVALLLVLYFREYAEYFVPVSDADHRSNQPLSALIHHAMIESIMDAGTRCWNWGGTWLSQDGVYRFKSRWGTVDKEYDYRVWLYPENGRVTQLARQDLAATFPDFFVVPYSALADKRTERADA